MAQHAQLFFFLYFAMTGMHALHMIIGVTILFFLLYHAWHGAYTDGTPQPSKTSACIGISSILSGSFFFRCCISSAAIL